MVHSKQSQQKHANIPNGDSVFLQKSVRLIDKATFVGTSTILHFPCRHNKPQSKEQLIEDDVLECSRRLMDIHLLQSNVEFFYKLLGHILLGGETGNTVFILDWWRKDC